MAAALSNKKGSNTNEPASVKQVQHKKIVPWSWLVLACTTINCVIAAGTIYSVTIYYVTFLQVFKQSASFTAWIPAAQNVAVCLAGPVASKMLPRVGARVTVIVGSLLMACSFFLNYFANSIPFFIVTFSGAGAAMCIIQSGNLVAMSAYFEERVSIALGFMLAGSGLGRILVGLTIEWAIEEFGWRGAMLIQSGMVLQICVTGSLLFPRRTKTKELSVRVFDAEEPASQNGGKDQSKARATSNRPTPVPFSTYAKDMRFWLLALCYASSNASLSVMMAMLKGVVLSAGLADSFKMVLTLNGVGSILGRSLSGIFTQCIPTPIQMFIAAALCAVANTGYIFATDHIAICIVSFFFGFFNGQQLSAYFYNVSWVFGHKQMPIVRGYCMAIGCLLTLGVPSIAGYTVDLTGEYSASIIIAAATSLLAGVSGLGVLCKVRDNTETSGAIQTETPTPTEKDETKEDDEYESPLSMVTRF